MKVAINCPWEKPQDKTLLDGTPAVINKYDPNVDYVIDLACIFSPLAAQYPVSKRVFAPGEPSGYMGFNPSMIEKMRTFYGVILSWHTELQELPQTISFKMGSSRVSWKTSSDEKKFGIGGIFTGKRGLAFPGYQLREKIISLDGQIKIPSMVYSPKGSWNGISFKYPQPSKRPALDFMFHLAIENCSERGYFTEKIMDCFTTYSVPVYFGDPKIGDIFVADGIIQLDQQDIAAQVNSLSPEIYYQKMPAILENRKRAERYWHFEENVIQTIKDWEFETGRSK